MKVYNIPVINKHIFSFSLRFIGRDIILGDRHFLEHMLFKSNKRYNAGALSREMTKLGGLTTFKIETSPEELVISGGVLKEDMPKVVELLNAILNDALFLEEEIEREKKVVLQEYYNRIGEQESVFINAIGDLLGENISPIGTLESIKNMDSSHLRYLYGQLINQSNALLFLHNGDDFASQLQIPDGPKQKIREIKVKGNYEVEVPEFPFSVVLLFYDQKPSLASYALKDYLNEMDAPFYKVLREEKNYCYQVGASQTFAALNHMFPQFNTECHASKNALDAVSIHDVAVELENNFIVNDETIYENVLKTSSLNKIRSLNNIGWRFKFEYTAYLLNCSFDDLKRKPSWEEFKVFAGSVKNKLIGRILLLGSGKTT